jgi:hypothetical protein
MYFSRTVALHAVVPAALAMLQQEKHCCSSATAVGFTGRFFRVWVWQVCHTFAWLVSTG